ncbi:S8 family serine peptidase [Lacticaseibacillus nasuensis]|uniref:S8 family serine peptidase n=1 Tax=Lacticaseibacillus nasuensis TaxID=944671 RepID=UPI0006D0BB99|nr:S8 family serine peptidase [Lacticaseibacillus nasuensis]
MIDDGVEPQKDLRLSDPDSDSAKANAQKAKDFIAKNGYGTYVNDKIIFAYNYSSNSDQNTYTAEEDHGEHVAGIIAANGEKNGQQAANCDGSANVARG